MDMHRTNRVMLAYKVPYAQGADLPHILDVLHNRTAVIQRCYNLYGASHMHGWLHLVTETLTYLGTWMPHTRMNGYA